MQAARPPLVPPSNAIQSSWHYPHSTNGAVEALQVSMTCLRFCLVAEQDTILIPSLLGMAVLCLVHSFLVEGRAGPQNHGASCLAFLIPGALQRVFLYWVIQACSLGLSNG